MNQMALMTCDSPVISPNCASRLPIIIHQCLTHEIIAAADVTDDQVRAR